jgi:hypothetical protein
MQRRRVVIAGISAGSAVFDTRIVDDGSGVSARHATRSPPPSSCFNTYPFPDCFSDAAAAIASAGAGLNVKCAPPSRSAFRAFGRSLTGP